MDDKESIIQGGGSRVLQAEEIAIETSGSEKECGMFEVLKKASGT